MNWEEDRPLENVTVDEIELLCEEAFKLKSQIDELSETVDSKKKDLTLIQRRLDAYLQHYGKKKWESKFGNIEVREKLSVKIPRDEESKKALFKWLQDKDIFWQTVSVNSMTLNALYNSEFEAHEGADFKLPGVEAPEVYRTVVMKGKK